jgi:hypothetical protein
MARIVGGKLVLPGRITISRPSCGNGDKYISISIDDDRSGCMVVEARVPLDGFAEALTGLGCVACEIEVFPKAPIGKVREVKTEAVPWEGYTRDGFAIGSPKPDTDGGKAAEALRPFEVDGWVGETRDLFNSHRDCRTVDGREARLVTFVRFVEAAEGPR